jgi:hypothetical protein
VEAITNKDCPMTSGQERQQPRDHHLLAAFQESHGRSRDRVVERIGLALTESFVASLGTPNTAAKSIIDASIYIATVTAVAHQRGIIPDLHDHAERLAEAARRAIRDEWHKCLAEEKQAAEVKPTGE